MTDASLCKPRYRNDLSAEKVRALLDYDADTGIFTWRVDRSRNARAGDRAGTINGEGYVQIKINGTAYRASRLAWLWMAREWPKAEIDHISGVRDDDRFCNLREANRSQNAMNRPLPDRLSGLPRGVRRSGNKFQAIIGSPNLHLGTFDTPEGASAAYIIAAKYLYGEFYSET